MTILLVSTKRSQAGVIPVQLILAGAIAAAGFGSAWFVQEWRYEKQLSDIHAEQALALAAAESKAHETTIRLQKQVDDAARKHASRVADLRRDAAGSRGALIGLRDELATSRISLPNSTCTSAVEYATTLNTVFGECTAEVGRLAEASSGHSADALMLLEAWPR